MKRLAACLALLAVSAAPAAAQDAASSAAAGASTATGGDIPLPASASDPALSPWKGWYFGSGIGAGFGRGVKGQIGGDSYLGLRKDVGNGWKIDVSGGAGYAPYFYPGLPSPGYSFADGTAKFTYDAGRMKPFFAVTGLVAKPAGLGAQGFDGGASSLNDAINGGPGAQAYVRGTAGFTYAINPNVSVGMAVSAGNGAFAPMTPW
ncbi:MAG: hypothetical protein KGQ28_04080, partial [Hyphomicrobiales bacterium]|nr:hypothetical protein [Hyphomicrobiales bacterium]